MTRRVAALLRPALLVLGAFLTMIALAGPAAAAPTAPTAPTAPVAPVAVTAPTTTDGVGP